MQDIDFSRPFCIVQLSRIRNVQVVLQQGVKVGDWLFFQPIRFGSLLDQFFNSAVLVPISSSISESIPRA